MNNFDRLLLLFLHEEGVGEAGTENDDGLRETAAFMGNLALEELKRYFMVHVC